MHGVVAFVDDLGLTALPVVGFFSHVHAERARQAREAGCTRVVPRSVFVQDLDALLTMDA